MIENTITVGTAQDFKDMVESYGGSLNKNNVGIVKPEAPKSEMVMTPNSDFFDFVKGLGLTSSDVAVVSAQQLMDMTQEKTTPKFRQNNNKNDSGTKIKLK